MRIKLRSEFLALSFFLASCSGFPSSPLVVKAPSSAQSQSTTSTQKQTTAVDRNALSTANMTDLGTATSSDIVHIVVGLKLHDPDGLKQVIKQHQRLSKAAFRGHFAPTDAEMAQVMTAMRNAGFTVKPSIDGIIFNAEAPAPIAAAYFASEIHAVNQNGAGRRYANFKPATIPSDISALVNGIAGLDNLALAKPANHKGVWKGSTATSKIAVAPQTIGGPSRGPGSSGFGPSEIAADYDFPANHGYTGSGKSIGIIVAGNYLDTDLSAYETFFSVSRTGTTTRRIISGSPTFSLFDSNWSLEASLDVDTVVGLAPGANVNVYLSPAPPSNTDLINEVSQAIADGNDVINASFSECESAGGLNLMDSQAQGAAAQGIVMSAASGDAGTFTCPFYGFYGGEGAMPASSPNWVAIGGTMPGNGVDYSSQEVVWNDSSGSTGGGSSGIWAQQYEPCGVTFAGSNRFYNDIAFAASPSFGASIAYDGSFEVVGGTSWASPIHSAMEAEIAQQRGSDVVNAVGALYAAYCTSFNGSFRDISSGSSGTSSAGAGWDFPTGMGSVDGYLLGQVI